MDALLNSCNGFFGFGFVKQGATCVKRGVVSCAKCACKLDAIKVLFLSQKFTVFALECDLVIASFRVVIK